MEAINTQSLNSNVTGQGKNKRLAELEKVKVALFEKPQTMKELDKAIGVMRESICWYCRTLRKNNQLFKVRRRRCAITGYPHVWELTTDPNKTLSPTSSQLNLF